MKIVDLINQYNNLIVKEAAENSAKTTLTALFSSTDTATADSSEKVAFIPNPQVAQQLQEQQQAAPQQAAPQQAAPQQAAPQQSLWDEVTTALQQIPPELQQQITPLLTQLQALPPEQREQQLAAILQQLAPQMNGGAVGQAAPMEAQASYEDAAGLFGTSQNTPAAMDDASSAEASAVEAKNELDNVRVNLSVRELLDLIGKGSATASLLKVKQLADQHNQKMEAVKQKAELEKQQSQQQNSQQQEALMGSAGGIYPQAMNAVG
jgi:hypothetical protein